MDPELIRILEEAARQRELNSWVDDYEPHYHQPRSSMATQRGVPVAEVSHIQKNNTFDDPIDLDESEWQELLEEQRQFIIQREQEGNELLEQVSKKSEILCQIHMISDTKLESTMVRLKGVANKLKIRRDSIHSN